MRIAYFDCFSGVSGDMILGALVDAGLPIEDLRKALAGLAVEGYRVEAHEVKRGPFRGTKVDVPVEGRPQPHRSLKDVEEILERSTLPDRVRADAVRIFRRLGEAEAAVHGTTVERVHFHEVGAVDAIVDVVGATWGLHWFDVQAIHASPLNVGQGFVEGAHGRLPVPAPGTLALLRGVPTYSSDVRAELTTPTGAAILSTLAATFGPLPPIRVEAMGYGAGTREFAEQPNLLRLILGEGLDEVAGSPGVPRVESLGRLGAERDTVAVIEANLDDMSPQFFEPLMDRLFQAGALDFYLTPIIMKKSRPATKLTVLAPEALTDVCAGLVLRHSTTLGLRVHRAGRWKLPRATAVVRTPFGEARVKYGILRGEIVGLSPEYEDCRRLAEAAGVPIQAVYREALAAARLIAPGDRGAGGNEP